MVREVGQPLPYCIFESAMAFEMGTARRERQIVRETQRQRLHDHGISGRPQVHFRREPSGVYRQLTPLRTGMQQRDGCIQRCGVNSPMNYRSLVYVLSTVPDHTTASTQLNVALLC